MYTFACMPNSLAVPVQGQSWHYTSLDQHGNANDGPFWPVGSKIDVTLHAADSQGDFFLTAAQQPVRAAY